MLKIISAFIFIFTLFTLASAPSNFKPKVKDDVLLITKENILNFYPALVVQKEINKYRHSIPENVYFYEEDTPVYTAFYDSHMYLCPVENKQPKNNNSDSEDYCLTRKKFIDLSKPILCQSEVKPLIIEYPQQENSKCGPTDDYKYYAFVYQDCESYKKKRSGRIFNKLLNFNFSQQMTMTPESINLFIYEFCYNFQSKETIYTYHAITSPLLLRYKSLSLEQSIIFPMKTEGYNLFGEDFEEIKEVYEKPNEYSMMAQKLVSPDDMELGLLRKPTFHYVNVRPMHEKLIPIWKTINVRSKKLATWSDLPLQSFTGTFGTLKKDENDLYLGSGRISIPEIWCKVMLYEVKDENTMHGIAFVLHNFIDENQPIGEQYCEKKTGNLGKWSDLENYDRRKLAGKYVYCCELNEKVLDLFPTLKEVTIFGMGQLIELTGPHLYQVHNKL